MKAISVIVALVLLSSVNVSGASNNLPVDEVAFGFEMDWSYGEQMIDDTVGIDVESIISMIEEVALDEGDMNLSASYTYEGQTYIYNVISENTEPIEIEDANGNEHDVTKKISEMNMRQMTFTSIYFYTDWEDNRASIDVDVELRLKQTFMIDIIITEYLNDDNEFLGLDVESEGSMQFENELVIDANLEGKSSEENLVFDGTKLDLDFGWSWEELVYEWRMGAPGDFYNGMHELANEDDLEAMEYECGDTDMPSVWTPGDDTIYVEDDCGEATLDFTYGFNYNIHLQNFPNADFGLPEYWNDLLITDDYDCSYGGVCDDSDPGEGDEYLEDIGYETEAHKKGTYGSDFLTGSNREFMETGPVITPNAMSFPIIGMAYIKGVTTMGEALGPVLENEGEQAGEDMEDDEGSTSTIQGVMEDITDSTFQRDMERIGEGVADEFEDGDYSIEPQPPFYGGDAKMVWDVDSGHGICWQVDVQTEEDGPMKSMFGPNLGESDEHEIDGVSYHFGAEAAATQDKVADMEDSQDIYITEEEKKEMDNDNKNPYDDVLEGIPFPNILLIVLAIVCVATIVRKDD